MKKKSSFAPLQRHIFVMTYANLPLCVRDKPCGLSWTDVWKLLHEN